MKLLATLAITLLLSMSMNAQRVGIVLQGHGGNDTYQSAGEFGVNIHLGEKESTDYEWLVGVSWVQAEHVDFWGENAKATGLSVGQYKRGRKGWFYYGTVYFGDETAFGGTVGHRWGFFGIQTGYNSMAGLQLGLNLTM